MRIPEMNLLGNMPGYMSMSSVPSSLQPGSLTLEFTSESENCSREQPNLHKDSFRTP